MVEERKGEVEPIVEEASETTATTTKSKLTIYDIMYQPGSALAELDATLARFRGAMDGISAGLSVGLSGLRTFKEPEEYKT